MKYSTSFFTLSNNKINGVGKIYYKTGGIMYTTDDKKTKMTNAYFSNMEMPYYNKY